MTLTFLRELGIEEEAARAIMESAATEAAEAADGVRAEGDAALGEAREKEQALLRELEALRTMAQNERIDGILERSGLRTGLLRGAVRTAIAASGCDPDAYLEELKKEAPELFFDKASYPCFAGALEEAEPIYKELPFQYLRRPKLGKGGGV